MAHHEEVAAALEAAAEWTTGTRGGCAAAAALLERAALLTPEEEPRAEGIAPPSSCAEPPNCLLRILKRASISRANASASAMLTATSSARRECGPR